jgi:hypothetical protein
MIIDNMLLMAGVSGFRITRPTSSCWAIHVPYSLCERAMDLMKHKKWNAIDVDGYSPNERCIIVFD